MEVAIMTGFSSYAKFSVEFKKYTGKQRGNIWQPFIDYPRRVCYDFIK